jgi:hypothetical protein
MPKFYYPSPDELQGAEPLVEDIWFERYQHILVRLANTSEGCDLLCIDKLSCPVVEVRKNCVRYDAGGGMYIADFRMGPKWGNVIRYRWQEVKKAYNRMLLKSILDYPPTYSRDGRLLQPVGGGSEHNIFYPGLGSGASTIDGTVGRASINETWIEKRTGNGTSFTVTDNDLIINLGCSHAAATGDDWRNCHRVIMTMDTSALGAGSTISAAVWSMTASYKDARFLDTTCIVLPTPNSTSVLRAADFHEAFDTDSAMALQASVITHADAVVHATTYNDFTLTPTGRGNISKTGVTTFGLMGDHDRDDNEPDYDDDKSGNVWYRSVDVSGTNADPKLVITYIAGFTPRLIMF